MRFKFSLGHIRRIKSRAFGAGRITIKNIPIIQCVADAKMLIKHGEQDVFVVTLRRYYRC